MALLNYTTEIEAAKSIGEIQECLRKHGASSILTDYDDQGFITSLSFRIVLEGKPIAFRLPTDWRPVLVILEQEPKVPKGKKTQEQAMRVAWRVTKDWVVSQMAIIEIKMVSMVQVFLPYAITKDGETFSEKVIKGEGPKLLE